MSVASRLPCDEATARGGPVEGAATPAQKRWVLAASILGSSLAFIDGTVVNVALPAIQQALGATGYQAQWVVESYALLLAALLLLGGALSDRLGRRRVFIAGVALFALASGACALASTIGQLIAARAVQGAGAALLVPGSMALISAHFPPSERGRAFGLWTGISGVTSAVGPLVGGWLVDQGSWEWAFVVNLPLAAVVAAIAWWRVPGSAPSVHAPLDLGGALCATLALGGAAYAFTEAPTGGWRAPEVIAALVLAVAAVGAFVAVERRHPAPMLPLGLLRNRTFSGANVLTLLLYAGLGGGLFFLPLDLVQVQGFSATGAGAALLPFILILFVLSRWAGGLVERHGARGPLVIGPLVAAGGFALLALPGTAASYWTGFLPGVAVLGLGMAVTIAPLTTTVMNAVPPDAAGVASGVNNAVSRMAGLLAIAVFGWVMGLVFGPTLQQGLRDASLPPGIVDAAWSQRDRLGALRLDGVDRAAADAVRQAVEQAFVAGFRRIMAASAGLALMASLVAALTVAGGTPPRG